MIPYEMVKTVNAEQLTIENAKALTDLVRGQWRETVTLRPGFNADMSTMVARLSWLADAYDTHHQVCRVGDYVVQEPDGRYLSWDRDVFEATFRPKQVVNGYGYIERDRG